MFFIQDVTWAAVMDGVGADDASARDSTVCRVTVNATLKCRLGVGREQNGIYETNLLADHCISSAFFFCFPLVLPARMPIPA